MTNELPGGWTLSVAALARGLDALKHVVLTCLRLGNQPYPREERGGRSPLADRFHFTREFVGKPVDESALDTLATMIHRAPFAPGAGRTAGAGTG